MIRNLKYLFIPALAVLAIAADDRPRLHASNQQNANLKTGPAVGTKIPPFSAADQNGKTQTFDSLRGPKGLVLAFVRSADW